MKEDFEFSAENILKIQGIIRKYPEGRQASAVLPLLDLAQRQNEGWISQAAMEKIAYILQMPSIKVFEVASFYTLFNLKPVGKYLLQQCRTTPCWLRGSDEVLKACQDFLNIKPGETTEDGLFSLMEVECLGACIKGPLLQINDDFMENLTYESTVQILKNLKEGFSLEKIQEDLSLKEGKI